MTVAATQKQQCNTRSMPLVSYADSSSSDDDDDSPADASNHGTSISSPRRLPRTDSPNRLTAQDNATPLPPLPSSFRNLYATNTRASTGDDPTLHAGRKRQVPHVQGNWPSHIFIEWYPTPSETAILTTLIASVTASSPHSAPQIHTSLASDLGVPLPLHISLSAPLLLRTEQRASFLAAARHAIRRACPRGCFRVALRGLDWAGNAEGSRWFLAQRVTRPEGDELNRLLKGCNAVAAEFGLAQLYGSGGVAGDAKYDDGVGSDAKDKSFADWSSRFHFSIGWALAGPGDGMQDQRIRPAHTESGTLRAVEDITVCVDAVKVKIGNTVTAIELDDGNT